MSHTPYEKHVFVCTQQKPDGIPSCAAAGGEALLEKLRADVAEAGLLGRVHVASCGCVGLCERGPNVLVQPDGAWYTHVAPAETGRLVAEHLAGGRPLEGRDDPPPDTIREEVAAHQQKVAQIRVALQRAGALPPDLDATMRAFMPARVILTGVELDVFTAVHEASAGSGGGGATLEAVAARIGAATRGAEMLLNALVALGLLEKDAGRFRNGRVAETFLREGAPHDSRAAIGHTNNIWDRWSTLSEAVKAGTALHHEPLVDRGDDWTVPFIAAMHKNATVRAPAIVGALDLTDVRRVLDLGGGSGAYSIAFVRAGSDLRATVFDLPTVTPLTRRYAAAAGVGDRVDTVDGDLASDDYGEGYDLVFISAIAHMLSPEANVAMLRKARQALRKGGRVVVQDFVLADDKTSPRMGALFALNMLVGTKAGSSWSRSEYTTWLEQAGFAAVRIIDVPGPTALVLGEA